MNEYRPGRFNILPVVIKNLMIINGLIFLALYTIPLEAQRWAIDFFALHNIGTPLFKPHQLITHIFMHATPDHIFSNMLTLWIFGSILENRFGPKRFLIFYMICGVGAALCYMGVSIYEGTLLVKDANFFLNNPDYAELVELQRKYSLDLYMEQRIDGLIAALHDSPGDPRIIAEARIYVASATRGILNSPMLGASGAVYGILFASAYLFPNLLIYLYFLIPIRLKYIAAFMIIGEILVTLRNNPGDPVAHFAHLGGVLISFLLLRIWAKRGQY